MNESDALASLLGTKTIPPMQESKPPSSKLRQPTGSSSRFWIVMILGIFACAGWIYGSASWLDQAIISGRFGASLSNGQIDIAANLIVFTGLLVIAGLLCHLTQIVPVTACLKPAPALLVGLAIGSLAMLLALFQCWIGNHLFAANNASGFDTGPLIMASLTTLYGAIVEEVTFRGWLQRRLAPQIGNVGALIIGALAFSSMHIFGGSRSPLSLLNISLAGLLFGLLLLRTETLWAPVGAHFALNWTEVDLLGLHPNPGSAPSGSIFNLDLFGDPIWGGSPEGLNAALPVTVAMIALLLPLLAIRGPTTVSPDISESAKAQLA